MTDSAFQVGQRVMWAHPATLAIPVEIIEHRSGYHLCWRVRDMQGRVFLAADYELAAPESRPLPPDSE